jgi:hypothetical protein
MARRDGPMPPVPRAVRGLLVAVLNLAACSEGPQRTPYLPQTAEPCPAVDALAAQRSAQPLPADFRPVSAVRCTFALAGPGSAASSASGLVWATSQRSAGPFGALVRALRLLPQKQDGNPVCPAVLAVPVLLALTDESGSTVVPALPATVCRNPRPEVQSALDTLAWTEIDHR